MFNHFIFFLQSVQDTPSDFLPITSGVERLTETLYQTKHLSSSVYANSTPKGSLAAIAGKTLSHSNSETNMQIASGNIESCTNEYFKNDRNRKIVQKIDQTKLINGASQTNYGRFTSYKPISKFSIDEISLQVTRMNLHNIILELERIYLHPVIEFYTLQIIFREYHRQNQVCKIWLCSPR